MTPYSYSSDPALQPPKATPFAVPETVADANVPDVTADGIPERRGVFAGFSNIEREGHWKLPRYFRALAVFGNVDLDLTHAQLGPVTDIELRCFLGNIEVVVPPGVRLECEGDATIGNFEVNSTVASTTSPDAPLVRIKAGVILGSIDVRVVDPNAPSLLQRIKAKWKLRDTNPN